MAELPNGFKSIDTVGMVDFSEIGIKYWSGRDSTRHEVKLLTTDVGDQVLLAHCLVGQLAKLSDREIQKSDLKKYDKMLFSMAYLIATCDFTNLRRLKDPRYDTPPIVYAATRDERVWGIHTSMRLGNNKIPLLALIARAPKSKEADVVSVISTSNRV